MNLYTRGTLRPRKDDEYPNVTKEQWDKVYQFEDQAIDDELMMTFIVAALLAVIVAGWIMWWVL